MVVLDIDRPQSCDTCKLKYMGVCVPNTGREHDPADESTWCPIRPKGKWLEANSRPKSVIFTCSVCGGVAYYHSAVRQEKKKCRYRFCPNCGSEMGE